MNWIESHVSLGNHPKTRRLARELGVSLPTAVGHLQYFWWFVAAYALDGDLSRFDAGDIADGAMWEGDAEAFVSALRSSRFIDEPNRVHDWTQYVERYLKARDGSTRGNHRRWHEGPDGKPSADCELCIASGSVPMSPPTPNGTRPPTPPAVAPESGGSSPPESADLTGPELTRPDQPDQTKIKPAPGGARPSARARDPVFEALAEIDGIDWQHLNSAERGKLNRARGLATENEATPSQIAEAADRWGDVMGDATRTAIGVMSNFQRLLHGPARGPQDRASRLFNKAAREVMHRGTTGSSSPAGDSPRGLPSA